jgi:hypothetical protein
MIVAPDAVRRFVYFGVALRGPTTDKCALDFIGYTSIRESRIRHAS